ncbi:hypothetical protein ACI6QG_14665 [Roseococcus sp. DSY-14]|uniref:hypothetical protein n=1 Tax=Roseococcus sp. DSY-14 TaxID=3369650 RepID=UPI00387B0CFA
MSRLSPVDLLRAHPWRRALFTTYSLSLSFFEAVALDELVRQGAQQAVVLADVAGVRNALSELGARRVGRDYEVEPVAVARAHAFHPKVSVLASETEVHVLVGSGNLTFGGWGGNLEVFDHLHRGFAADALADAAVFFETLAASDRVKHGAAAHCLRAAADIRGAAAGGVRAGAVRFVHSLDRPIAAQLADAAEELGGARRLAVAAPYWDGGAALDSLCARLGLERAQVHAHGAGAVPGLGADNWPRAAKTAVEAVELDPLRDADAKGGRRLHAKAFEVVCRRGRVTLSGSANATWAALEASGNVEACVLRLEREPSVGWTSTPATPLPKPETPDDGEGDAPAKTGILRAALQGDDIAGRVLSGGVSGRVEAFAVSAAGRRALGPGHVGPDGGFSLRAPSLELEAWRGARLVLRLEAPDGSEAEGFLSFAGFAEILRRAGPVAPRLFAVLAGSEVPSDVAAVLSWACDNPGRLAQGDGPPMGGRAGRAEPCEARANVASLLGERRGGEPAGGAGAADGGGAGWRRFLEALFSALRERRGPIAGAAEDRADDEGDDGDGDERPASRPVRSQRKPDPALAKALDNFERLLGLLLASGSAPRNAEVAFDVAHYVCDRLRPDPSVTRLCLERIVRAFAERGVSEPFLPVAAAAALVARASEGDAVGADMRCRARLLRLGWEPSGPPPDMAPAGAFLALLAPDAHISTLWSGLARVRTMQEQVRAYLGDLRAGARGGHYPDLMSCTDVWPLLAQALRDGGAGRRVLPVSRGADACPVHGRVLPSAEAQRLRARGVARAPDCCGGVLVCEEA